MLRRDVEGVTHWYPEQRAYREMRPEAPEKVVAQNATSVKEMAAR